MSMMWERTSWKEFHLVVVGTMSFLLNIISGSNSVKKKQNKQTKKKRKSKIWAASKLSSPFVQHGRVILHLHPILLACAHCDATFAYFGVVPSSGADV